jgi:3'-phosphoadenosine 5'-phosphosulfate sulfotransferase (PAPS reductase)/FAD synthetase
MSKTYIFSWGGGVNSTAILAMIKLGMIPELTKDNTHIVFADTGAEMPYTYEHTSNCLQPMAKEGWKILTLRPYVQKELYRKGIDGKTLEDYVLKGQIPQVRSPWCSSDFKRNPIKQYRKVLCGENWAENSVMIIGYGAEEKHRARDYGSPHTQYPLIEHGIDRAKCFELCKKAELPIPRKSGCYFCPMQSKTQWIELYEKYNDYFVKAEMAENNNAKGFTFIQGKKLREKIKYWQKKDGMCEPDLFEQRHCLCEL